MLENENKRNSIFFRLFQYMQTIFSRRIDIKGDAKGNIVAGDGNIIGNGNVINVQTSIKIIIPFFIIIYAVFCSIAFNKFDVENNKNEEKKRAFKTELKTAKYVYNNDTNKINKIDGVKKILSQIPSIQKEMLLPTEPKFYNPISVFCSLFCKKVKNDKAIDELKNEIVVWKENLDGIDINGIDLSGLNMSDAKLSNADLSEADFRGASLINADFRGANLYKAKFQNGILWNAKFYKPDSSSKAANLNEAEFCGAKLRNAKLQGTNLYEAKLIEADLISADLSGANLNKADLSGANLSGAIFAEANIIEMNLNKAKEWSVKQISTAKSFDQIECGDDIECEAKLQQLIYVKR